MWLLSGVLLLGAAIVSVLQVWRSPMLTVELGVTREVDASLPLGEWSLVRLHLTSNGAHGLDLEIFDHVPGHAETESLPARLHIPAADEAVRAAVEYRLRPTRRGDFSIGRAELWRRSTGDLVRKRCFIGESQNFRVLPNFRPVLTQGLAGLEARLVNLGVHLQRKRGDGLEFEQLRDYRSGDSMRHIDWKATARRGQLIARQYQEERNQQVVLMLDCGRRMHAREGDLTHFDHILNAVLLLAYIAIRQGDAVGLQAFAGAPRWLPPVRGAAALGQVLHALHDLQTTDQQADYVTAAAELAKQQRRRALVVLMTNIRDEDTGDLLTAIHALRQRHLVLVASLRERELGALTDQPVDDLASALEVSSSHLYLAARRKAHARIRSAGAFVLDVEPQDLPASLVSSYVDIKRAGRL